MHKLIVNPVYYYLALIVSALGFGCASSPDILPVTQPSTTVQSSDYVIGPGDRLNIFVWRNPEVSAEVPVRPDGKISTPLVEDMQAVGKTSTQLARDLEKELSKYLKKPIVTVTVTEFVGTFGEQIRVVGQAGEPKSLSYREYITLLDVMIEVGGLTEFAAGNRAKIIRRMNGKQVTIDARLEDLLNEGDISANIPMRPGDILIIPQSWF